jgi:hypothetical protein
MMLTFGLVETLRELSKGNVRTVYCNDKNKKQMEENCEDVRCLRKRPDVVEDFGGVVGVRYWNADNDYYE